MNFKPGTWKRAWAWILILALVVLGAVKLRFDADVLNGLPSQLPAVQGLKLFQERFSSSQDLVITVEAASSEQAEAAAEKIAQRIQGTTNLVRSVTWKPQWLDHPDQATELVAYIWFNQSPELFSQLTNRLSVEAAAESLRTTKEQLATSFSPEEITSRAYDPFSLLQLPSSVTGDVSFSQNPFSSADGRFRIISVEPQTTLAGYRECRSWLAEIRHIVEAERADADVKAATIHFTGRPAFVSEISTGMERDLAGTSTGTLLIIGLLFYLTHRRILPLLCLLVLLVAVLAVSVAMGGLVFGTVNVMSIGFASILLGLAEDFGIVLYQESQSHPDRPIAELRREATPGIVWSAITAAGAFLALNLSSLPGLRQLGTFVAIGILVAAALMLALYLPMVLRFQKRTVAAIPQASAPHFLLFETRRVQPPWLIWTATLVLLLFAGVTMWFCPPAFDRSPDPLRPRSSEAYETLAAVKQRLQQQEEPLWVVTSATNEVQMSAKLTALKQHLQADPAVGRFNVPTDLIANPDYQRTNRVIAAQLLQTLPALDDAAREEGFTPEALHLTRQMFATWKAAIASPGVYYPTGALGQMVLAKISTRSESELLALSLVYPKSRPEINTVVSNWPASFSQNDMFLSGWDILGSSIFDLVLKELPMISIPVLALVTLCLWLAFRNVGDVLLSFAVLAFAGLMVNTIMAVLGWKWNILNLMAVPMLLGIGIDFSIHMQLALSRSGGDLLAVRRSVGKALLLAGATTVAGFGSLSFASNAGIASLGITCALGILVALLTAVYLLPIWWQYFRSSR